MNTNYECAVCKLLSIRVTHKTLRYLFSIHFASDLNLQYQLRWQTKFHARNTQTVSMAVAFYF